MLTRSIDLDPFQETIEEKIFRNAKRLCIIFAVAAVALSALDIANVRTVENARTFLRDNGVQLADVPDRIRSGIEFISFTPDEPSATAAIPRDAYAPRTAALTSAPMRPKAQDKAQDKAPIRAENSPVAGLAAARHQDAVEFAMASPASLTRSELRIAADPAPNAERTIRLASADTGSLPSAISPLSLPMSAVIPLDMVPMPRSAPGAPPPSPAQRLKLEGKEYAKAERCLANAIYFEARSEPIRGQMAVAQVIVNRAFSGFYPNDICGVVYQNAHRRLACQFTFACDGKSKAITERGHWARATRIAKQTLEGQIYVPEVAKSTHYHAIYVNPNWVGEMKKLVRYGLHNFYRPHAWGNGADVPAWGSGVMAQSKKN